jgi:ATP-binding cassette subfamily B (MDR/TAP) protein 1
LDEATSALDSESEYVVQEALDKLLGKGNRTTIVIAHRLSTIRNADMIAVVKDGAVVETGTHSSLLESDGEYAKLVEAQTSKGDSKTSSSANLSALPEISDHVLSLGGNGQIEFRDVHFHYPTRPNAKIFKGLNLNIQAGETLALVGPSGGGKSSVISLIERFYDPIEGGVFFEGNDIRELNIKSYRDQIGYVSQEPTLFNTTIAENIKFGKPDATQDEIEDAARQANAHDFIMSFPNGYDTEVGENASQLSGGQRQRCAIARAIVKKPKVLILDEATSALDTESERIVQEAIDRLMQSKNQTIIVIAHRLSTIVGADRIAVIADGVLKEIGSHSELMNKPDGRYKRLVEFQNMTGAEKKAKVKKEDEEEEDKLIDTSSHHVAETEEEKQKEKEQSNRAKVLAKDDIGYFFVGAIGSILAGLVFPCWGIVFAYMIELLFRPVFNCDPQDPEFATPFTQTTYENYFYLEGFESCPEYWKSEADAIQDLSLKVMYGWLGLMASTLLGNVLLFYGFGTATERMNKRVRDSIFVALMRQDMAYYDTHPIAKLSAQIEDDAAMMHSFSGEPIRTLTMTSASVLVGLILSFVMMWPFAAMTLLILPFLSFGAYMEMKMYMGEDEGAEAPKEGEDSAGAIVVETLLSIRTVASLAIQKMRAEEYENALKREDPVSVKTNLLKGAATGLGFLVQLWGMGFMFWWGGWVLQNYGNFTYRQYLISMFSLLFSLSGMSVAFMGATDKAKAKVAADRIFALIDRESPINSISDEGKKFV